MKGKKYLNYKIWLSGIANKSPYYMNKYDLRLLISFLYARPQLN